MAFENVGPQWNREEPWQVQQSRIMVEGLTSDRPWARHQRRLLGAVLAGLLVLAILAFVVALLLG